MADFLAGPITDPLPQRVTPASATLTEAAVVAVDLSLGDVFYLALTADRLIGAPTNVKGGQKFSIVIKQPAAGGKVVTFDAAFTGLGAGSVSSAASAVTVLSFITVVDGTTISHRCIGSSLSGGAVVGQVTILNTSNSATVAVGTAYNGKPVLVSINNSGATFTASMFALVAQVATGTLTIKLVNPTTGAAVNVSADTPVAYYIAG